MPLTGVMSGTVVKLSALNVKTHVLSAVIDQLRELITVSVCSVEFSRIRAELEE